MARYTGAKLRVTRRLGDLPGFTSKKGNQLKDLDNMEVHQKN